MFWDRFYSLCLEAGTKPNPVCAELGLSSATATHWKNGKQPIWQHVHPPARACGG